MTRGRKRASRIIAAVFAVVLAFPSATFADYIINAPGEGSPSHPYLITTCDDLQDLDSLADKSFKLIRNIDCSDYGTFSMIGNYFTSSAFTGTLDGNGFSIIGLHTTTGGMFGYTSGATIKNLNFTDSSYTISTGIYAGTVVDAAENGTTLTNVHSDVDIDGSAPQMGGLVGYLSMSTIETSSFTGSLDTGDEIGGLVGLLDTGGVIQDSFSHGTTTGGTRVGGLAGVATEGAAIHRSYSASTLGHSSDSEGGLIGDASAPFTNIQITDSFSASTLGGADSYLGGVIGYSVVATPIGTVYFDTDLAGTSDCEGAVLNSAFSCVTIDNGGTDADHMKGTETTPPLDNWDWNDDDPWMSQAGEYPILRGNFQALSWGDMNGDSIDDSTQGNVFSLTDYEGNDMTFVVDPSSWCITNNGMWWHVGPDWGDPDDPGFTNQTLTYWSIDLYCRDAGMDIPVTVIFDKVYDTSSSVLRHFNVQAQHYSSIPATFGTTTVGGTQKTTATYHITEGGPLDGDGEADGFILDPITLASTSTTTTVPGAPNTGIARQFNDTPALETSHPGTHSFELPLIAAGLLAATIALLTVTRRTRKSRR